MPSDLYAFGPFELDPDAQRLLRDGGAVEVSPRQFALLHLLVARAGQVLSKDALVEAAWGGVAVTDNSVEQAVSALRRLLASGSAEPLIETQARRGYRFTGEVRRMPRRASDEALEALLAPHRAWTEGRAALETLEGSQILRAREVFARVLTQVPDQAPVHVGLANALIMGFEMTRSDAAPDLAAVGGALEHAREACRLDPGYGEAWATLGFVLERAGAHADALAAARRAVALEPDNWRHRVRLAYTSWGEERLREADRTLALLPGFPLAHWLAATVHVARQVFDEAERHLRAGIDAEAGPLAMHGRFSGVALHWLLGLILLATGDRTAAAREFDRELANEASGHLYARECCANTWYAIAALRAGDGDRPGAANALQQALARVPAHPLVTAVLAAWREPSTPLSSGTDPEPISPDRLIAAAVHTMAAGGSVDLQPAVAGALRAAPPGSALWWLPVEPLLGVWRDRERWSEALAVLRNRAA